MPGVGLKSGMLTAFGSDELDADDVDVGRSTCCDFLSSANVSARSSLWVCDGRGHMPCPDHHAVTLTVADARRWMQRAKQIHASFELPAHGHELSPDPRLDGSDRNPEIFRDLLVRAPIDDRQKQARAALWLELIEHGP